MKENNYPLENKHFRNVHVFDINRCKMILPNIDLYQNIYQLEIKKK